MRKDNVPCSHLLSQPPDAPWTPPTITPPFHILFVFKLLNEPN